MTITNLDPGTTYQMRVVAKNGVGLESSAEWQEVTTGGLGKFRLFHGSQPPSSGVASGEGGHVPPVPGFFLGGGTKWPKTE